MAKVSKFARAKKVGSKIYCPKCNHERIVFHFGWSALVCPGCKAEIGKTDFNIFRHHADVFFVRSETAAPVDLKTLFELMRKNDPSLPRWDSLPTFGGIEPEDTEGVWSWDSENMIVGTCSGDIQIVPREKKSFIDSHLIIDGFSDEQTKSLRKKILEEI